MKTKTKKKIIPFASNSDDFDTIYVDVDEHNHVIEPFTSALAEKTVDSNSDGALSDGSLKTNQVTEPSEETTASETISGVDTFRKPHLQLNVGSDNSATRTKNFTNELKPDENGLYVIGSETFNDREEIFRRCWNIYDAYHVRFPLEKKRFSFYDESFKASSKL